MLSEKERKTLDDIERHLYTEDPTLAHALVHGSKKAVSTQKPAWGYIATAAMAGILVVVSVVALMFALSVLSLIAIVLAPVVVAGGLLVQRPWQRRARPGPEGC